MGQDAEQALALPSCFRARPQGGAQQPLVAAEDALRLPALPVDPPVPAALRLLAEAADHLPAVARLGPLPPGTTTVERDHRGTDAVEAGRLVVSLGVVGGVGQQPVPQRVLAGLA